MGGDICYATSFWVDSETSLERMEWEGVREFITRIKTCLLKKIMVIKDTPFTFPFLFGSPRRRSKTPDSSEKVKRNVHFQDEEKYDKNDAGQSSNLNERTRQDVLEIVHPDGKVIHYIAVRNNF